MGTCLECETNFDLDDSVEVGHFVVCPSCKTRLEVLDLAPVVLDYAIDDDDVKS